MSAYKPKITAWLNSHGIKHRFLRTGTDRDIVQMWHGEQFKNITLPVTESFSWALIERRMVELLEEIGWVNPDKKPEDVGVREKPTVNIFRNQKVSTGAASEGKVIMSNKPTIAYPKAPANGRLPKGNIALKNARSIAILTAHEAGYTNEQIKADLEAAGWQVALGSINSLASDGRIARRGAEHVVTPRKATNGVAHTSPPAPVKGVDGLALQIAEVIAPILSEAMGDLQTKADKLDALLSLMADD